MATAHIATRHKTVDVIGPEEYTQWRESYLGALTERIEEETIFRLSGDLSGKRLLDLGCGDGTYSIAAFQRGARVTGVDISGAMLETARRRAAACGASVEWCAASAESLPYDSGTFDIAFAVTILCLTRNPLQVLKEVERVLHPGGLLVTGELGRYSCWALSRRVRGWLGSPKWRGAHFWILAELEHMLQQTGCCVYNPPLRDCFSTI